MSIKARNAILITILILLFASALGFITFSGFGCGKQPEPEEQDGYNVNFYTTVDVGTGESATLFLSVDGGITYNQYVIQSADDNVWQIFTNVKTISFYFGPSNPENVASAVLNVGDEQFDIATATSASTAFTKAITQNTDVEPEIAVVNTYTVSAEATMRRVSGSVGGLLFVSINGGEFNQFADLTADDVGTSKVITDDFEKVYALAFYYTPGDDSVIRTADYQIDGGIGEDFLLSTSPETATVFEPTDDCTIEFDVSFRPFGYRVTLDQSTTGNVSSGISISVDGGTFVNYYGDQNNVLIESYASSIDFYFIYDSATVTTKSAIYSIDSANVNFVNSTHANPVHKNLTGNLTLTTNTSAILQSASGYSLTIKFNTSDIDDDYRYFSGIISGNDEELTDYYIDADTSVLYQKTFNNIFTLNNVGIGVDITDVLYILSINDVTDDDDTVNLTPYLYDIDEDFVFIGNNEPLYIDFVNSITLYRDTVIEIFITRF